MTPPAADDSEGAAPRATRQDLPPGARIATLEIEDIIGYGRHGPAYRARDPEFGSVIVKEFRPEAGDAGPIDADPPSFTRSLEDDVEFAAGLTLFRLMGQALCDVRHPNLVPVRRCIEAHDTAYLVMDDIKGENLDDVLNDGGGPRSEAALRDLLLAILGALDRLHRAGLLHRDVKPANIRLKADGVPVLVDFGAALPADLAAEPPYPGIPVPGYAAPELYRQETREGPWTDLYGLAAVAYRIVCNVPPPDAPARASGSPLIPAVEIGRDRYPEPMLAGIDRALSLSAADRPQSADAWAMTLRPPAMEPSLEAPDPPSMAAIAEPAGEEDRPKAATVQRAPKRWPQPRPSIAAVVVALLMLPAAVIGSWIYYRGHIKSEWIVDASGKGDAKSLAKVMATARAGASIRVRPGRYAAPLAMTRPMSVEGDGDAAEIVIVASGPGPCITITAETGSLSRLSFIGESPRSHAPAASCVDIAGASTVSVSNAIIRSAAGPALRIGAEAAPAVRANRIATLSGPAVIAQDRAGGVLVANAITGSGAAGILVRDGAAPEIKDNRIDSTGQAGILVTGESASRVTGNRISNSAWSGIEVRGQADPAVAGNRIDNAGQAGIYVYDGGRGAYRGNIVIGSAFSGVVVGPGGNPTMSDNRIAANGEHGILVLANGAGRYSGNTIIDNSGYGVAIDVAADVTLDDLKQGENTVSGNRQPQIVVGRTPTPPEPRSLLDPPSSAKQ